MAVQFIDVESFFSLRKFIGPKKLLLSGRIAYFEFLRRGAEKMAAKFKGYRKYKVPTERRWRWVGSRCVYYTTVQGHPAGQLAAL